MKTNTQLITVKQLNKIVPELPAAAAENYVPLLNAAMLEQSITNRGERCAFTANLAHESQHFTKWFENLNYKAGRLLTVFPKYFKNPAAAFAYAGKPQAIANRVYANRMGNGNEASGDGWRFRGRGPIGLTGRENYKVYGQLLGIDLEGNPDLAAQPQYGFRIAALFWKRTKCDALAKRLTFTDRKADRTTLTEICKRINGGKNGLEDRIELFDRAARVLGPAVTSQPGTQPVPVILGQASNVTIAGEHPKGDAVLTTTGMVENSSTVKNGDASGVANLPAESDTSTSDTGLVTNALNSSKAKGAALSLWARVGKHATFVLGSIAAFVEANKTTSVMIGLVLLGVLAWVAYHNRKGLAAYLRAWLDEDRKQ